MGCGMNNIVLKSDILILRPLSIDDLYSVHEYAGDVENTRFMMRLPNTTLEETKQFLIQVDEEWRKSRPMFYEFAVVLGSRQIGAVSIYLNENADEGELGWILNKKYWGNGYATEAALLLKHFAINELKLTRLIAHCDCRNKSSARVIEKIGLRFECEGERLYSRTGERASELMYALDI